MGWLDFEIKPEITDRRLDICQLVLIILGSKMHFLYSVMFCLTLVINLAAFVMMFSASMAANIPLPGFEPCNVYEDAGCRSLYSIWGSIFGAAMMILTIVSYEKQKTYQTIVFFMRFVVFGLGFICCLHLIFTEKTIDSDEHRANDAGSLIDFRYYGLIVPITWTPSVFQVIFPEIIHGT
jgi:hypothetical protein